MSRRQRRKSQRTTPAASERMNQLKAKALTQAAGQAWAFNQRHQTIALLTEALRREPTNVTTLLNLATAYGRQRQYDQAEELLTRLLILAPRKAGVRLQAARVYASIDRPEPAIECYRRCLELDRDKSKSAAALVELAALHERRHELDEARAALVVAQRFDPANDEALLLAAILQRRGGEASLAETTLRTLVGDDARAPMTRSHAWYELAQLLDKHEQYDEAFNALQAAKGLLKPFAAPYAAENELTLRKTREMVAQLSRAHFDQWKAAAALDSPYRFAILTSHPRSGTTLVEQALDSHVEAISADEFDVFTHAIYLPIMSRFPITQPVLSILDRVPPAVRRQAREAYWRQTEAIFAEPIGDRLLIDKNPAMMLALPAMAWAFPEAKLLIALRDPRDVVLSCYMQRLAPNPISVNWLSLSAAAGFYAQTMSMWLAVRELAVGSWIEFRYEDVVDDFEGQTRRILEFLGLPWDERVLRFDEHAREKMVRSPTYHEVTQPVYRSSVGRWRHYAKHLEPVLERLAPFASALEYDG